MKSVSEKILIYKSIAQLPPLSLPQLRKEMKADWEATPEIPVDHAPGGDRQVNLEKLYQAFCNANDYYPAKNSFEELCRGLSAETGDSQVPPSYQYFKENLCGNTTKDFFNLLDQKAAQRPYKGQPCKGKRVLIIGGGPCGLRAAIEVCLLGGQPIIVEKRDYFSRYNVANLWEFFVKDLKSIGAKVLQKDLCVRHDRASIKIIQLALFKISMLLGATFRAAAEFQYILQPKEDRGWRAVIQNLKSKNSFEVPFDFVIGADGKKNSLDFSRIKNPMSLAIGITCNFVYNATKEEIKIASDKQGAVAKIYRQEYFKMLQEKGFDLENVVYFQDKTHYFIFTAKKDCLLKQGVLKSEDGNGQGLLHPENTDYQQLERFCYNLVQHITEFKLPNLEFAKNHNGVHDVNIFDFTNFYQAERALRIVEAEDGSTLLQQIVGDTLIEPFWPIGSGMALGFLSVMDAAWTIRNWCLGTPMEEVIQERKDIFANMTKINQSGLRQHGLNFTINPETRYKFVPNSVLSSALKQWQGRKEVKSRTASYFPTSNIPMEKSSKPTPSILDWYQERLAPFNDQFEVNNLTSDWFDGRALCALAHLYKVHVFRSLEDFLKLEPGDEENNLRQAFNILSQDLGLMTPEGIFSDDRHRVMPEYLYDLRIKLRQLEPSNNKRRGRHQRPQTMTINPKDDEKEVIVPRARAHSTEDIPSWPVTGTPQVAFRSVTLKQNDQSPRMSLNVQKRVELYKLNANNNSNDDVKSTVQSRAENITINSTEHSETDDKAMDNSTTSEEAVSVESSTESSEREEKDEGQEGDSDSSENDNSTRQISTDDESSQNESDREETNQNFNNSISEEESETKLMQFEQPEINPAKRQKKEVEETLMKLEQKVDELEIEEERLLNKFLEIKHQKRMVRQMKDRLSRQSRLAASQWEEHCHQEKIRTGNSLQERTSSWEYFGAEDSELQNVLQTTQAELKELLNDESYV